MTPISILQAHEVLAERIGDGSPAVPPKRSDDLATGRQLWSMNKLGLLRIIEPEADDQADDPPADYRRTK